MTSPEVTPSNSRPGSASATEQHGDNKGTEAEDLNDEEDERPAPAAAAAGVRAAKSKSKSMGPRPLRSSPPIITLTEQRERELLDFLKKANRCWANNTRQLYEKWQPFCERYGYSSMN